MDKRLFRSEIIKKKVLYRKSICFLHARKNHTYLNKQGAVPRGTKILTLLYCEIE